MNKIKFLACLSSMIALVSVGSAYADHHESGLDGKTFTGTMTEKGKTAGDKDNLVFKNGKFRSTACEKHGFKDATYTANKEGEVVHFETETHTKDGAKLHWVGTVTGTVAEATATMTKAGEEDKEFHYQGTLLTAKKAKK